MNIEKKNDYLLFFSFSLLIIFGLLMLSSASSPVGEARFGDSYFFIKRQLLFGVLPGIAFFIFFLHFNYHHLKSIASFIFFGTILLLLLVFIPGIGSTLSTGARSWLVLPGTSLQPSEVAKLTLILFFSAFLTAKNKQLVTFYPGFTRALLLGLFPVGLVLIQPDVGTAAILFAIMFGLLFMAETKPSHMLLVALIGFVTLFVLIQVAPYRASRLTIFLHPELDPQGIGYQVNQAKIAVASGGLFGLGYQHSRQKFQYLPEVQADSIFAVIAEEMGFVVMFVFIALLLFIGKRGLQIAKQAPDLFGRFVASGIIIWFMAQSFLNIGAIIGLLPLTGVPLPFVSHGGTALSIAMAAVGILMNIEKLSRI